MIGSSPLALVSRRVVAIIRLPDGAETVRAAVELAHSGISAVEVTVTTPGALEAVAQLRGQLAATCLVGVGTVRRAQDVVRSADSGAQFLVTPTFLPAVLAEAGLRSIPVLCGAFTPTEIDSAWAAGAAGVKVFPASLGGPGYIREIRAPLTDVPLWPTGGVTVDLVGAYARAGAVGVGVGSSLVSADLAAARDWMELRRRARSFVEAARDAWSSPD